MFFYSKEHTFFKEEQFSENTNVVFYVFTKIFLNNSFQNMNQIEFFCLMEKQKIIKIIRQLKHIYCFITTTTNPIPTPNLPNPRRKKKKVKGHTYARKFFQFSFSSLPLFITKEELSSFFPLPTKSNYQRLHKFKPPHNKELTMHID